MGILIQGGRIVDAATDTDKKGDIYLEDGVITEIGEKLKIKDKTLPSLSFDNNFLIYIIHETSSFIKPFFTDVQSFLLDNSKCGRYNQFISGLFNV